MAISNIFNKDGSLDTLNDKLIGDAYPTVKEVSQNIEYIKHLSANLESVFNVNEKMGYITDLHVWLEDIKLLAENLAGIQTLVSTLTGLPDGKSAYEVAVEQGYVGSEISWLASLVGAVGEKGDTGDTGLSAYDAAVAEGFVGSQLDWVLSLNGSDGLDGESAYALWILEGNTGTKQEFLDSLIGESTYEAWLADGNTGTENDFLNSLIGKSAYQEWLDAGNTGTPTDFFAAVGGGTLTRADITNAINTQDGSSPGIIDMITYLNEFPEGYNGTKVIKDFTGTGISVSSIEIVDSMGTGPGTIVGDFTNDVFSITISGATEASRDFKSTFRFWRSI